MYIRVHAIPNAKKETVKESGEQELTIAVREPAERNMANKRIRALVAEHYQVLIGKVTIVSGHRSPTKMFSVEQ